jgi:type IX secretion system PorP/SprF family membrane protein
MKKYIILFSFFAGLVVAAKAQVDPLYAQYLSNPLVINPAYAGLNNNLNASLTYRKQWAGFDGSPTTVNASGHTSLFDNKMAVGAMIVQDNAAVNKNMEFHAMYAYRLDFEEKYLSFGLQAGVVNYRTSYDDDFRPADPTAPEFQEERYTRPNFGAGVIFHSERYLIGLSVPRMLSSSATINGVDTDLYSQHFYLTGAYVLYLTPRIRFKPSVLFKGVQGAPISTDLNLSVNLDETITAGVFTRNLNTYGVQGQLKFKERFRVGYAFEVPSNNSVGARFTTHELMFGVNLSVFSFHTMSITNF